ncbi:MAG: hypothetical protein ACR2RE_30500, partial [Geminicoccaceae bacterium]
PRRFVTARVRVRLKELAGGACSPEHFCHNALKNGPAINERKMAAKVTKRDFSKALSPFSMINPAMHDWATTYSYIGP